MLEIVTYPAPILRRQAEPVDRFDDELSEIIEEMIDIMYADDGVGLAAPQVNISKQLLVLDDRQGNGPMAVINPEIVWKSDEKEKMEEGCLSLPDIHVDVTRPISIHVRCQNAKGEELTIQAEGYFARILQHEMDHLNGVLLIDHASPIQRQLVKSKLRKLEKSYV